MAYFPTVTSDQLFFFIISLDMNSELMSHLREECILKEMLPWQRSFYPPWQNASVKVYRYVWIILLKYIWTCYYLYLCCYICDESFNSTPEKLKTRLLTCCCVNRIPRRPYVVPKASWRGNTRHWTSRTAWHWQLTRWVWWTAQKS